MKPDRTQTARVCVSPRRECAGKHDEKEESQDVAAPNLQTQHRGECKHSPRTTTNYTLGLSCSSSGRENNFSVHKFSGGRDA
jgi:hypothetical protein